jgi:alpha-tubulin suppressor-like RCC1 family protein
VPVDAAAVSVNVTVVWPSAAGFVSVWPSGEAQPATSSVNFVAGQVVANQVTVKLGASHSIDLVTNAGCPHIVVDLTGAYRQPPPALSGVTQVAVGDEFTCASMAGGTVKCWGRNNHGQIGDGTQLDRARPTAVAGLSGVSEIGAGGAHVCARTTSGSVWYWGQGARGQLGNGAAADQLSPVPVTGLTDAVELAVGYTHACARRATGAIVCWGTRTSGELGTPSSVDQWVPAVGPSLPGTVAIEAGRDRTCARDGDGTVRCWGAQTYSGQSSFTPTTTMSGVGEFAVAGSVCGVVAGSVSCVGGSSPSLSGVVSLGLVGNGGSGGCFVMADSTVRCGGTNTDGRMGPGDFDPGTSTTVRPVTGLVGAVQVAVASSHACAVLDDGSVRCWGNNDLGQLGDGEKGVHLTDDLPGLGAVTTVAVSPGGSCALSTGGVVHCWGDANRAGPGSLLPSWRPAPFGPLPAMSTLSGGMWGMCATSVAGEVWCWPGNGNGGSSPFGVPTKVAGLDQVSRVEVGLDVACALRSGGTVWCWPLGTPGSPQQVGGLTGVTEFGVGGYFGCAVMTSGSVACWGLNSQGQLGQDPAVVNSSSSAQVVAGLDNVVELSVGLWSTCARRSDATVSCWGGNSYGELGDNSSVASRFTPGPVPGLHGVTQLSGIGATRCAQTATDIRCWGLGDNGRMNNGSSVNRFTPAPLDGLTQSTQLAIGWVHGCAVTPSGSVRCWGVPGYGALGDGVDARKPRPVTVVPG